MSEALVQALSTPTDEARPQSGGDALVLAPNERRVYRVPAADVAAYEKRGFQRYTGPTIDDNKLNQTMAAWAESTKAAVLGAANNLPFASYGIEKLAPDDVGKRYAEGVADASTEHPFAYGLGAAAGAVGSVAATGPLAKAAGIAAGASGRALAAGASKILPVLPEAGGAASAAAEAAPRLFSAASAGAVGSAAAEGALYGGVQSTSDQLGDEAMARAMSPEGKEQLAFSFGRLALDASIGAVAGGAIKAGALGISALGRSAGRGGKTLLRRSVLSEQGEKQLFDEAEFQGKAIYDDPDYKPAAVHLADDIARRVQGGESAAKIVANNVHSAGTTMADIEARVTDKAMSVDNVKQILSELEDASAQSAVLDKKLQPLRQYVNDATAVSRGNLDPARASQYTMTDAKHLYDDLYKEVNFDNLAGKDTNPLYAPLHQGGVRISKAVNRHVEEQLGSEYAGAYRNAKRNFNVNASLASRLSGSGVSTVQDLVKQTSSAAVANAFAAALGAKSMGVFRAAGQGAAFNFVAGAPRVSGLAGRTLISVGERMARADDQLRGVIKAGLYGVAPTFNDMAHSGDYQLWASRALAAKAAPLENHSTIMQGLTEGGVPDDAARGVSMQLHGAMIDAAGRLPPRQGPPDMPTMSQPDTVVQRKWMGQMRSSLDPYYALKFPTADNMKVAKQYFPQTVSKAQAMVLEQAVANPALPASTRYYMSRVLGRPVSASSSPRFYQMLMQLRQQSEAEEAQNAQATAGAPKRGAAGPSGVASEATRLQTISE